MRHDHRNQRGFGRLLSVAFVITSSATTVAMTTHLSALEEGRLRALLQQQQAYGLVLLPTFAAAPDVFGFDQAIELVGSAVGRHFVDAALAAGGPSAVGRDPDPIAAMPVWVFEPERGGADVLLSSARLWAWISSWKPCAWKTTRAAAPSRLYAIFAAAAPE